MPRGESCANPSSRFRPTSPHAVGSDVVALGEDVPPILPQRTHRTVWVHARRVAGRVVVGIAESDGTGTRVHSPDVLDDVQTMTAVVLAIRNHLAVARADGITSVEVQLESAWLPKQLVQRHRSFRSVGLYGRVLQLHDAAAGLNVELVGPREMPARLVTAVSSEASRVVRRACPRPRGRRRSACSSGRS